MGRKDLLPLGAVVYVVYPADRPRCLIDGFFMRVDGDEVVFADPFDGFLDRVPLHCCFLTLQAADAYLKERQKGGQA